jgi:YD repeat-containing protein
VHGRWVRASAAAAATALTAACLAGCGSGAAKQEATVRRLELKPGEVAGAVPTHDPLQQSVEVAYVEPQTELGVDVISGKLYMAAEDRISVEGGPPGRHERLIGLVDPQLHNRIFAYRSGGIPGVPGWDERWGRAPAPAPGVLPIWSPPRLVTRAGRPVAVVLADGRRVRLDSDARGRVVRVHWATARGEALLTSINYRPGRTTVRGPAGVARTYRYDAHEKITEVDAPGAAATARHDTADGYLDSKKTAGMLGYRLRSGTAERNAAYEAAPRAIGENSFAQRAVGGHQTYGVASLKWMRVVDAALRKAGVLDVAEAIPIQNGYVEDYAQEGPFDRITEDLEGECHISVMYFGLTYGLSTTPAEIATIAYRLAHGPPRWIEIEYANQRKLGCAKPL